MKTKIHSEHKDIYTIKKLEWYYFIPFFVLIGVIPIIVRGKYIELDSLQALFWKGQSYHFDLFSYWKSFWFIMTIAFTLLIYIMLKVNKKLPLKVINMNKYYIPLFTYIVFVIISSLTTYYPQIVSYGFTDMYQGTYVLLCYSVLTFLTINYINNEDDINLVSNTFIFLIIVVGVLGICQFFGYDYLKSKIGMNFIIPNNIEIKSFDNVFDKFTIYATMYNSNFVGSFSMLCIPLSLAFYKTSLTKVKKISSYCAVILSISLCIGCNSRAGYIGILAILLLSFIMLNKKLGTNKKLIIQFAVITLFIVIIFNITSQGKILNQFSRLNIFNEFKNIDKLYKAESEIELIIKDIKLYKNKAEVITNKNTLNIEFYEENFRILDNYENELNFSLWEEENTYVLNDINYEYYKIFYITNNNIGLYINNRYIEFYFTDNGVKIVGSGNRLVEPIVAPIFKPLSNYERFASGRGYIWSRTIMMLPNVIFKGYGPDTYAVVFPQDDFVAKLNSGMDASMIVDKPHNMYLQIAINTGIISLLALLVLWGNYIISSLKLYIGIVYDSKEKCIGFACFMAVIGYLVAGIFNDQIVSVAPLFWITLGLGISINERLKYKNKA